MDDSHDPCCRRCAQESEGDRRSPVGSLPVGCCPLSLSLQARGQFTVVARFAFSLDVCLPSTIAAGTMVGVAVTTAIGTGRLHLRLPRLLRTAQCGPSPLRCHSLQCGCSIRLLRYRLCCCCVHYCWSSASERNCPVKFPVDVLCFRSLSLLHSL